MYDKTFQIINPASFYYSNSGMWLTETEKWENQISWGLLWSQEWLFWLSKSAEISNSEKKNHVPAITNYYEYLRTSSIMIW